MPKNLCPTDKQPCIEHDCVAYLQLRWQDEHGRERDEWQCAIVTSAKLLTQMVMEQGRVQASMDKASNAIHAGLGGLIALGTEAARRRAELTNGGTNDPPRG